MTHVGSYPVSQGAKLRPACPMFPSVAWMVIAWCFTLHTSCAELTRPSRARRQLETPAPTSDGAVVEEPGTGAATGTPAPAREDSAAGDQIDASHILVSYRGAPRAKPTVTRDKSE